MEKKKKPMPSKGIKEEILRLLMIKANIGGIRSTTAFQANTLHQNIRLHSMI